MPPNDPSAPKMSPPGPPDSLLRLIADAVPALIAYYDLASMRCQFANRQYAQYNGHTPQSILGLTVRQAIGEAAWATIEPHVKRVTAGHTAQYVREQVLPDGQQRMIEVKLTPHFDDQQTQLGAFVLINDITAQWRAEQAIRDSEERMRKFAQATTEGIVFHQQGVITDANAAVQTLLGYPLHDIIGRSALDFIAEPCRAVVAEYIASAREDPYETTVVHRSGRTLAVEVVGKTMPFHGGSYRLAVLRDIGARKAALQRIEYMALHDHLTQLPNRLHVMERLDSTLALAHRRQGRVAALFIDLDNFKRVNDSKGHHAGDALLREVAALLKSSVRQGDIVSRLGGDEFLVVLTEVAGREEAAKVAAHVLRTASAAVPMDLHPARVTLSIGVSLYPEDGQSADDLIRHADAAMYRAKNLGRGNVQFFSHADPVSSCM